MVMRVLPSFVLLLTSVRAFQVGRLATACNRSVKHGVSKTAAAPSSFSISSLGATAPLFLSTLDDHDRMEKKVQGRKRRVVLGYRGVAIAYAGGCAMALRKSGMTAFSCYTIAGPLLAAGMAYILSGAVTNDRLSSDTYKRLNLFLGKYGLIGLTIAASTRQPNKSFWYYWSTLSFVALVNSIKGYGYGVKGWKLEGGMAVVKEDWAKGIKATFQTLLSFPPNFQAAGYLAATLFVGTMKLLVLGDIISLIQNSSKAAAIVSQLSNYARLSLLTGISVTLKDAADRGRLEGTTFIELNFMSSVAFAAMAAYRKQHAASSAMVGAATVFSIMTALNGVLGLVAKQMKENYHDTAQKDPSASKLPDDIPGIPNQE